MGASLGDRIRFSFVTHEALRIGDTHIFWSITLKSLSAQK